MLRGRDIVCVSSIDWDFLWQQHQEIMSAYARAENRVLFIENTGVRRPRLRDAPRILSRLRNRRRGPGGFRREQDGLVVHAPIVVPFPHSRLAQQVNRRLAVSAVARWLRHHGFREPILWSFLPTQLTLDLAEALQPRLLVYYCTDYFAGTSRQARPVAVTEAELLRRADLVFAASAAMVDHCGRHHPGVVRIPVGVDTGLFERVREGASAPPEDLRGLPRPLVGFVGGIRAVVDLALVQRVAEARPDWTLVFVGPIQTSVGGLARLPNVRFLGPKAHADIPRYVKAFAACLMPYVRTLYTESVSPAKLYEYLIMGKPVVSTGVAEAVAVADRAEKTPILYLAETPEEFIRRVDEALSEPEENATDRIVLARGQGWAEKIAQMSALIDSRLDEGPPAPRENPPGDRRHP
jgi:glycosyltransferase involved in cell wall biosynthesis